MVVVSLGTKGVDFDWTAGGNPIKEPPKGLEPIGDSGWYKSPEGLLPGDRDYCQYNSMSPVCGGNPFTTTGLGLDAELNVDPCGFTARIGGSIAFVKMPEQVFTYRREGACRREYEKPPEAIPPPPAPAGYDKPANTPIPTGFGQNERVAVGFTSHAYGYSQTWNKQTQKYDLNTYDSSCSCSGINVSGTYLFDGYQHLYQPPQAALAKCEFTFHSSSYDGKLDVTYTQVSDSPAIYAIDSRQEKVVRTLNPLTYRDCYKAEHNPNQDLADLWEGKFGDIFIGRTGEPSYYYQEYEVTDTSTGLVHTNVICDITTFDIAFCIRKPSDFKRNPPQNLPPDEECCMQCCSGSPQSQSQQNNDALLRQILAEVQKANKGIDKINKSLGSDNLPTILPTKILGETTGFFRANNLVQVLEKQVDYVDETAKQIVADIKKANDSIGSEVLPLQFPASINPDNTSQITLHNAVEILNQLHLYIAEINQEDVDLDKIKEVLGVDEFPAQLPARLTSGNDVVEIKNIPQLLKQQILYTDETTGEYPVKVKIEDTDPTEEGNQSEELEFANASELMAEVFGTLMNVAIDANVLVQLVTKALMETGLVRKQLHTTQSQVDALIKHQGFEIKEKIEAVPFTFTVPQTTNLDEFKLEDFCKESIQKIEIIEYKGKNTYIEDAAIIRHMHGIIKGVFFRGIAKDAASVAGEISKLLKKQGEAIDKISDNSVDDLENFIEDFERGFSSYTGGTQTNDPNKPYGLPYEQRPRVKIIKKPTTDNPGAGQ